MKIEIVLRNEGGKHNFENVKVGSQSSGNNFFHLARHWLVFFENHKIQVHGRFEAAGRNAQGRWGEI